MAHDTNWGSMTVPRPEGGAPGEEGEWGTSKIIHQPGPANPGRHRPLGGSPGYASPEDWGSVPTPGRLGGPGGQDLGKKHWGSVKYPEVEEAEAEAAGPPTAPPASQWGSVPMAPGRHSPGVQPGPFGVPMPPARETVSGGPGTAPVWKKNSQNGTPRGKDLIHPHAYADQQTNNLRISSTFKIFIQHLPTGKEVAFEGWVTAFSDDYTSQWNEETVYGRMDPLATFQGTRRTISINFDIPNDSRNHAISNMYNVRRLIQFMYPTYEDSSLSQQNVLKAGPLLAMKWINLVTGMNGQEKLVGYINGGLSYAPDMGEGGFIVGALKPGDSRFEKGDGIHNYFPKKLSLSFSFNVLHTHLVGWAPAAPGKSTYVFGGNKAIEDGFPNAYLKAQGISDAKAGQGNPQAPGAGQTENAGANLSGKGQAAPTEEEVEAKKNADLIAEAAATKAAAGAASILGQPPGTVDKDAPPATGKPDCAKRPEAEAAGYEHCD